MKTIDFEKMYSDREDPWGTSYLVPERYWVESTLGLIREGRYKNSMDAGCGEGFFTQFLLEISDRVTGIDVSSTAIKRARVRLGDRAIFICGDIINLDITEKFDLICCLELLYYLEKKEIHNIIDKFHSLLEDKGKLLISARVTGEPYFTYDELIDLLDAKFKIKTVKVVKTKLYHGKNMNIYKKAIRITEMAPRYLSEHIAILAEK